MRVGFRSWIPSKIQSQNRKSFITCIWGICRTYLYKKFKNLFHCHLPLKNMDYQEFSQWIFQIIQLKEWKGWSQTQVSIVKSIYRSTVSSHCFLVNLYNPSIYILHTVVVMLASAFLKRAVMKDLIHSILAGRKEGQETNINVAIKHFNRTTGCRPPLSDYWRSPCRSYPFIFHRFQTSVFRTYRPPHLYFHHLV